MKIGSDLPVHEILDVQIVNGAIGTGRKFQHLIEITIIQLSIPSDRDHFPTHDLTGSHRIIGIDQSIHVFFEISSLYKIFQKSTHRHIRDRPATKGAVPNRHRLSTRLTADGGDRPFGARRDNL